MARLSIRRSGVQGWQPSGRWCGPRRLLLSGLFLFRRYRHPRCVDHVGRKPAAVSRARRSRLRNQLIPAGSRAFVLAVNSRMSSRWVLEAVLACPNWDQQNLRTRGLGDGGDHSATQPDDVSSHEGREWLSSAWRRSSTPDKAPPIRQAQIIRRVVGAHCILPGGLSAP